VAQGLQTLWLAAGFGCRAPAAVLAWRTNIPLPITRVSAPRIGTRFGIVTVNP